MTYPLLLSKQANLRQVSDRLYVGNLLSPATLSQKTDLTSFVDLCSERGVEPRERAVTRIPVVMRLPIQDGSPIPDEVIMAALCAYQLGGKCLIACHAGISRSVSIAYAILRCTESLSHDEACERVFSRWTPEGRISEPLPLTIKSAREWAREYRRIHKG